ncbi:MAG: hypothetical protein EXQ74_05585 [Thermoleophilia bacterium]|nr:hypothetical protein [Thermoleophilia bacterium]
MHTVSPLTRDLTINGYGLIGVAIAGVVVSSAVVNGGPTRAIVPFIIVALILGLAQVVVGGGWLRTAVAQVRAPREELDIENSSATLRRAIVPTLIALILVLIAVLAAPPFAALLAGLAFGAGATDLRSRSWIRAAEAAREVTIFRAVTVLPFATSRKDLWAVPVVAGTDTR